MLQKLWAVKNSIIPLVLVSILQLPASDIYQLIGLNAIKYNLDHQLFIKIAECESGVRQFEEDGSVVKSYYGTPDYGVMQINTKYHGVKSKELGYDIMTTAGNIEYGAWLMAREGTRPWKASMKCWDPL